MFCKINNVGVRLGALVVLLVNKWLIQSEKGGESRLLKDIKKLSKTGLY